MLQKFLNDAKKYYKARLEEVDFQMKSEAARVNINKWVEKKTLKVKTSISYFSLRYFMFLAALGTAEMAMFGYMGS